MARKERNSRKNRKEARSRSSRSRRARQEGWKRWLPTAALALVAVLIGVGVIWFSGQRGNTGSTAAEATIADSDDVPRIAVQELKAKLDVGQAVLFDARSQESYTRWHIAGAISMPQDQVAARVAELPADKLVVFYCS